MLIFLKYLFHLLVLIFFFLMCTQNKPYKKNFTKKTFCFTRKLLFYQKTFFKKHFPQNSNCYITQILKLWQLKLWQVKNSNYDKSKTQIVTTQKLKLLQNSNWKCENFNGDQTPILRKLKNQVVTKLIFLKKLKKWNCDQT